MLSVLSSGTINLTEELHRTRQDLIEARFEAANLAEALAQKRERFVEHLESFWFVLKHHQERVLKSRVFHAFALACHHWQMRTTATTMAATEALVESSPRARSKWRWLWQKKVFGLWRRASTLAHRSRTRETHHQELEQHKGSVSELREHVERLHGRRLDTDGLLLTERTRVRELESELSSCKEQVKELQSTLKQCYVQQFEDSQKREELERHFSKLAEDFRQMKVEKEKLHQELLKTQVELQDSNQRAAEHQSRLKEASSELCLAEEVIDDITTSKLVGLQRFFDHYDLPSVCLSLFGKILELQHQLRSTARSIRPKGERSAEKAIETEVCQQLAMHDQVSRRGLQDYIEHLKLNVSASMVAQVLLALLGLDGSPCDQLRFTQLLAQPPAWRHLDFATALWGSAGEPAAAVVQQHRNKLRSPRSP
ncbi:unnamed protein product [Durusdinium trenchii]|uniref:Protein spalten n=2 Tax=Durusdinium trenchii TaxID=1381693 RepID=A0ABP0I9A1_9DINO